MKIEEKIRITKTQLLEILEKSDLDYLPNTDIYIKHGYLLIGDDQVIFTADELNQKFLLTIENK